MFSTRFSIVFIGISLMMTSLSHAQLDNTKIAFVSNRDGNREIYVMDAAGTNQANRTQNPALDAGPAWSPDGTRIAFSSDRIDGIEEIYVMDAAGTNQRPLTTGAVVNGGITWSPDGTQIAFTSDRDGNAEIYVINAQNGTIQVNSTNNLTNNPALDHEPAWSPDGTRIAFRSNRFSGFCCNLVVMNVNDPANPTQLTTTDDGGAAWSPDGTQIAYHSHYPNRDASDQQIFVINVADPTHPIQLTDNPGQNVAPSWSPDGTHIAFASDRSGNLQIYVMNANGTNQVNRSNNQFSDGNAAWSPFLVLRVTIDIKPGSDPNSINLSAAGVIPVAILSSATFDATQVDPASVTLAGARVKLIGKGDKYSCHAEDVNGDTLLDLVCQVVTAQFMVEPGDSLAVLEASTFGGAAIRGEDSIRIVPD